MENLSFLVETANLLLSLTGLQAHSQSVDVPPYIRTRNNDSTAYPGQQTVTCELRLPVAGNRAGEYQFQVEITPNITSGNHSVFATTPTVNLGNFFEVKKKMSKGILLIFALCSIYDRSVICLFTLVKAKYCLALGP